MEALGLLAGYQQELESFSLVLSLNFDVHGPGGVERQLLVFRIPVGRWTSLKGGQTTSLGR